MYVCTLIYYVSVTLQPSIPTLPSSSPPTHLKPSIRAKLALLGNTFAISHSPHDQIRVTNLQKGLRATVTMFLHTYVSPKIR